MSLRGSLFLFCWPPCRIRPPWLLALERHRALQVLVRHGADPGRRVDGRPVGLVARARAAGEGRGGGGEAGGRRWAGEHHGEGEGQTQR